MSEYLDIIEDQINSIKFKIIKIINSEKDFELAKKKCFDKYFEKWKSLAEQYYEDFSDDIDNVEPKYRSLTICRDADVDFKNTIEEYGLYKKFINDLEKKQGEKEEEPKNQAPQCGVYMGDNFTLTHVYKVSCDIEKEKKEIDNGNSC